MLPIYGIYRSLKRGRRHPIWSSTPESIKETPGPRDWTVYDLKPAPASKPKRLTPSERFIFGLGILTAIVVLGSIAFLFFYILVVPIASHMGSP